MLSIDSDAKIAFSFDSTKQFSIYLTEIIVERRKSCHDKAWLRIDIYHGALCLRFAQGHGLVCLCDDGPCLYI